MIVNLKCCICGAEFRTERLNKLYCSDACRRQGRSEYFRLRYEKDKDKLKGQAKKWRENNPERIRQLGREWREKNPDYERDRWRKIRGTTEQTKTCVICGKEFVTTLPHKKTCSDECKNINIKDKNREREKGRKRKKSPEEEHRQWIRRRYGSEEGYQKYLTKKAEEKLQLQRRREAEKEARYINETCVVCGNEFKTLNPAQKTCCTRCSKKLSYARKQHRIPKNQIVDNDITLEALYRRDSGVCYLCGGLCDWNDKTESAVGGKYPSIDHIVPVSRGGFHAWDNVRLAHFACNAKKSDDIMPDVKALVPQNAYSEKRSLRTRAKRTAQISKSGTLRLFESATEAARQTGIPAKGIQNCARMETNTYHGYIWVYV